MAIHFVRGVTAGLLAGCAASWVMNQFQQMRPQAPGNSPQREPQEHKEQQKQQQQPQERGESDLDEDATVKTAKRISRDVFQHELTREEKEVAGPVVHYAYGSLVGALYGGLAELLPVTSVGFGLPFGFALWLLGDEIAVPALGLAKKPAEYPPSVHADALSAHFMYGMTTDVLRRVLRHVV